MVYISSLFRNLTLRREPIIRNMPIHLENNGGESITNLFTGIDTLGNVLPPFDKLAVKLRLRATTKVANGNSNFVMEITSKTYKVSFYPSIC